MKVSTKGRYALRVMVDLAKNDSKGFIPLKDIARRQDITLKYTEQIILLLTKAGFVKSLRGSKGGYRLARRPEEYTVGEILRISEGSMAPIACVEEIPVSCTHCGDCSTRPFWEGLWRVMSEYADSMTLADLLREQPCDRLVKN